MLTQETLKNLLHYDPKTGIFTGKSTQGGIIAGMPRGSKNSRGYIQIKIKGKTYKAHRLAWLYVYGYFPNNQVDHIDHNVANNVITNLRECSPSENQQNQIKAHCNNKSSQYLGVSFHKRENNFRARIIINGKYIQIGSYPTKIEAYNAYLAKKAEIHKFSTLHLVPTPPNT